VTRPLRSGSTGSICPAASCAATRSPSSGLPVCLAVRPRGLRLCFLRGV
jgi:hypothetical protein